MTEDLCEGLRQNLMTDCSVFFVFCPPLLRKHKRMNVKKKVPTQLALETNVAKE